MNEETRNETGRLYGGLLVGFAILSVLGAAHHPVAGGGHDLQDAVRALQSNAALISSVHAFLLAVFVAGFVGMCGFARRLGLDRPLALAGLVAMALGITAMICAGAINGFAVPSFAAGYADMKPDQAEAVRAILRMSWRLNQAFADIGAVLWTAALLLWSAELAFRRGAARIVGIVGGLAALAVLAGLLAAVIELTVSGFMLVTALLALWAAAVGLLMLNRRLPAL